MSDKDDLFASLAELPSHHLDAGVSDRIREKCLKAMPPRKTPREKMQRVMWVLEPAFVVSFSAWWLAWAIANVIALY